MNAIECLELLMNEFSQYIPNDRESLSEITPRIIYKELLCRLKWQVNELEEYKQMYEDLCK